MQKLLEGSFIYRLLERIALFYPFSIIARIAKAVSDSYGHSTTQRVWDRVFGCSDSSTSNSGLGAFLTRCNSALARFGRLTSHIAERSVPVRIWKSQAVQNSLFYRILFSRGTNRIIIIIFALYLPIDYVLRTLSPIAAISSAWDEAFLIFGIAYVVFRRIYTKKALPASVTPFDTQLLLFLGIGFMLLCVVSPYLGIAIAGLRAVVQYMLWFYVITRIIENDEDIYAFCGTIIVTATLIALHGIYQYIIGVPIPSTWVSQAEVGVRTRVFSIIGSPNIMGSFLVMFAPLTASFAYKFENLALKVLMWCCTIVMCLACLVTFSRGAWLGMAVAVFVFALYRDRKLIALMALAVGVAVFIPQVANRITFLFTSEFDFANMFGGRGGRRREGMNLLRTVNVLFGYGLGRFGGAVAMQNQINANLSYFYMDNYYLKTLIEMGYIGLGGYLFLLASFSFNAMRSIYRTRDDSMSTIAQGLFAGMLGVMTHCLTENIFEVPYMNAYFWGMAGLIIYIGFLRKPKLEVSSRRVS